MKGNPFKSDSSSTAGADTMGRRVERDFGFQSGGSTKYATPKAATAADSPVKRISPWKMIAFTVALGVGGYLYIAHVFYTQGLLTEVNQLRGHFENARIDQTDAKLTYERMTGPAEVYNRARLLGLIDGGPADKILTRN
jgi:hypothetical protein